MLFAVTALVAVGGLGDNLAFVLSGEPGSNSGDESALLPVGIRVFRFLSFCTVQSNLLVLAASLTLVLRPGRDGRVWRVLRLDALLGISVTGLVYWVFLAPGQPAGVVDTAANLALHLATPVLAVAGWLVLGPRPRITWSTVAWAVAWPIVWVGATFVRGAATGWYPYPFIDAGLVGYPSALAAAGGVVALGLALAVLYRWVDGRLPPTPPARSARRTLDVGR